MPSRRVSLVRVDPATQRARERDPEAYRQQVEQQAFKRGVRIIWINPPRAKRTYTDPVAEMTPVNEPFRYQTNVPR